MAEVCSQHVLRPEFLTKRYNAFQGFLVFAGQAYVNKSTDVGLPRYELRTWGYQVQYFHMKNVGKRETGS